MKVYTQKQAEELDRILNKDEAYKFFHSTFRDGYVQESGTAIIHVLPHVSLFSPNGERIRKRESVLERFKEFFNKF
jgi:type I restriction enzyme R subunit